jgi:LPS sulfotransferase NodH
MGDGVPRPRLLRSASKFIKHARRRLRPARPDGQVDRGYLVCSTPRSGSTYLCQLLASTGVLGVPREYLNLVGPWGKLDPSRPTDLRHLFERALKLGATPNGIYGLKCHADHFSAIAAVVDPFSVLPNPRFIRIRRKDLVAQAISWLRAAQTGQFHATSRRKRAPVYDAAEIRGFVTLIAGQRAAWDRFHAAIGCTPLLVEYESLVRNPQREIDRIAEFMGVPLPVPIDQASVKATIQRDELNDDWHRRFLQETGDEFSGFVDQ